MTQKIGGLSSPPCGLLTALFLGVHDCVTQKHILLGRQLISARLAHFPFDICTLVCDSTLDIFLTFITDRHGLALLRVEELDLLATIAPTEGHVTLGFEVRDPEVLGQELSIVRSVVDGEHVTSSSSAWQTGTHYAVPGRSVAVASSAST